ncbi:MAG: signal peptidase II [Pseudomonadales bacterium]|nr:signal peptidase II [Pseudomonadales bacterium]
MNDIKNAANKSQDNRLADPVGMLSWLWITGLVIGLDQLTKNMASANLELYESIKVMPLFNMTLAHNSGAAFSFLAGEDGWQRWFFAVIAVVVSIVLVMWLYKLPKSNKWLAISLALILGGAIGNVIDRIVLGYVVDFLDVYWGHSHFPAFNIADSAITVGALMMGIDVFRNPDK